MIRQRRGGPISSESSNSSSAQPAARSARGTPFHLEAAWEWLSRRHAPRRAVPADARAPSARPLVVEVDDADAAESPRHPEDVPRLDLPRATRQVSSSWPASGRRRDGLGGCSPLSRRHRPTEAAGTQRWCAARVCAAWETAEPSTCPQEGAGQGEQRGGARAAVGRWVGGEASVTLAADPEPRAPPSRHHLATISPPTRHQLATISPPSRRGPPKALAPALNSPPEARTWRPSEGQHPSRFPPVHPPDRPPTHPPSAEQHACRPSRRRRPSA